MTQELTQAIELLTQLSQKNSLGFARAYGAIARQTAAIGRVETLRMSADDQRASEAGNGMASLRAECTAIVAGIPASQLVALKCLVGDDPVLISQRFCAMTGRPVPGMPKAGK
jgi:ABC-type uncharacterized transport system fused permease/ATPase subunit